MAREKVSHVATVWIITVKLVWNTMKMPHAKEYCRELHQKYETNTLPWKTKDRIVDEICQEKDDPRGLRLPVKNYFVNLRSRFNQAVFERLPKKHLEIMPGSLFLYV